MSESNESKSEVIERARLQELELRYSTLFNWAKDQEFVTVYRAEGDPLWGVDRSGTEQLKGTWYTESWGLINHRYKPEIESLSGKPAKVFALIVPRSLLDSREAVDRGMVQVNVLNKELLSGRKEVSDPAEATTPTLENYLNQFPFVREYQVLLEKYQ